MSSLFSAPRSTSSAPPRPLASLVRSQQAYGTIQYYHLTKGPIRAAINPVGAVATLYRHSSKPAIALIVIVRVFIAFKVTKGVAPIAVSARQACKASDRVTSLAPKYAVIAIKESAPKPPKLSSLQGSLTIIKGVPLPKGGTDKPLKGPSQAAINTVILQHVRLGYIGLNLLKKTTLITKGILSFNSIKPKHLRYKSYNAAKLLRRPLTKPIVNPPYTLKRIEGDIFIIRLTPLNSKPYKLILVQRKTQFKLFRLLKTKEDAIPEVQAVFKGFKNKFGRYLAYFYYDGGTKIAKIRPQLVPQGIGFLASSPYAHN